MVQLRVLPINGRPNTRFHFSWFTKKMFFSKFVHPSLLSEQLLMMSEVLYVLLCESSAFLCRERCKDLALPMRGHAMRLLRKTLSVSWHLKTKMWNFNVGLFREPYSLNLFYVLVVFNVSFRMVKGLEDAANMMLLRSYRELSCFKGCPFRRFRAS